MQTLLKTLAIFLLLLNGTGAIYGSYHLIVYPDGSSLQMNTAYLQGSPFHDYFIPGIILFALNGACSILVLAALLVKYPKAPLLVTGQGAILTGWIIVQVMMVTSVYYLHFLLGGMGVILVLCGLLLHRSSKAHIAGK
jgi:hypothetical protein